MKNKLLPIKKIKEGQKILIGNKFFFVLEINEESLVVTDRKVTYTTTLDFNNSPNVIKKNGEYYIEN